MEASTIVAALTPLRADNAELIGNLGVRVLFAVICALVASSRGRSGVGWAIFGFLLACLPFILLLVLPNLKLEHEKEQRHRNETRRLRELLKKERQVADLRHEAHEARLGVHDRALGLDTSAPQLQGGDTPPPLPAPPAPAVATTWYYAVDGTRHGPVPAAELRNLWLEQRVPDATIVWCEGMKDWRPIGEVGDLLGDTHA